MSELKQRLQHDLTEAIRARDTTVAATIRMALTAVTTEEVSGAAHRELSDADVLAVLTREAKKRREASAAYSEAGRPELAAREDAELQVLEGYLPQQLTDDELETMVQRALAETGATEIRQMGAVVKAVQSAAQGRAEGGRIAAAVRTHLTR